MPIAHESKGKNLTAERFIASGVSGIEKGDSESKRLEDDTDTFSSHSRGKLLRSNVLLSFRVQQSWKTSGFAFWM